IGLDERACDAVPGGARLAARAAAVQADADVVASLGAGDLERGRHLRAVDHAREVVLERAAVDPPAAVAGPEDHARDRGLALARALVSRVCRHQLSVLNGFGAWAVCGCSAPA